jgi:hypothetical protein
MPNSESPPAANIVTDEGPYILSNKSYKDVCIFVVVLDDTEESIQKYRYPSRFNKIKACCIVREKRAEKLSSAPFWDRE